MIQLKTALKEISSLKKGDLRFENSNTAMLIFDPSSLEIIGSNKALNGLLSKNEQAILVQHRHRTKLRLYNKVFQIKMYPTNSCVLLIVKNFVLIKEPEYVLEQKNFLGKQLDFLRDVLNKLLNAAEAFLGTKTKKERKLVSAVIDANDALNETRYD